MRRRLRPRAPGPRGHPDLGPDRPRQRLRQLPAGDQDREEVQRPKRRRRRRERHRSRPRDWTINAYADDGDGVLSATEAAATPAATDDTAADGTYTLLLDPGSYVVCEATEPGGWTQTHPSGTPAECAAGSGLEPQGHAVTLTSGQTDPGNDFGNFQPGTVVIQKDVIPDGDTDFTYTDNIPAPCAIGPLRDDGNEATTPSSETCTNVTPGSYTVSEDDPTPSHELTDLTCTDSDPNGTDSRHRDRDRDDQPRPRRDRHLQLRERRAGEDRAGQEHHSRQRPRALRPADQAGPDHDRLSR